MVSLPVAFAIWWGLWLAMWFSRLEDPVFALLAPVLPVYYGVLFLEQQNLHMALLSLGLSGATLILLVMAMRRNAPKLLLVGTHLCLCIYWIWSFALVAMGV